MVLNLRSTVFDNLDFVGRDELPQPHQTVDGGIHRKKIGIDNGNRNLPNMRTRSSTEKTLIPHVPRYRFGKFGCRSRMGLIPIARRYALPIEAGEYAFVAWSLIGCLAYSSNNLTRQFRRSKNIAPVVVDIFFGNGSMAAHAAFRVRPRMLHTLSSKE